MLTGKQNKDIVDITDEAEDPIGGFFTMKYGYIFSVQIIAYDKHEFIIELKTSNKRKIRLHVGGSAENIYRYNPYSKDITQHATAGINKAYIIKERMK